VLSAESDLSFNLHIYEYFTLVEKSTPDPSNSHILHNDSQHDRLQNGW